jgi:hypothetical protein
MAIRCTNNSCELAYDFKVELCVVGITVVGTCSSGGPWKK